MPRVLSLLVALCALAAACGGGGSAAGSSEGAVVIERPTRASVPWAEIPGFEESTGPCPPDVDNDTIADAGTPIVSLERIVDLPDAATIAFMRSGTAFVGSRDGRVYRWDRSLVGPVLDLSDDTLVDNDAGLLGLAVGPAGDHLYMYRTDGDGDSVLSAYRLDSGRLDAGSATVLLDADQPTSQHNAGSIVFDRDGHLFVALGDGGGLGDPFRTSQDIESAFGAMLRLEPRPGEVPAAVAPAGNPFAGPVPGNDLIWATGLRNPYRFSIDPLNGDLWIGDVGQQCAEEINRLDGGGTGGENLGWNVFEGRRAFLGELASGEIHHEPLFSYGHGSGRCAVIAGHVYRGLSVPDLQGRFVFADHCSGEIMALDPETGTAEVLLTRPGLRATEIAVDRSGELYVVDLTAGVWALGPA